MGSPSDQQANILPELPNFKVTLSLYCSIKGGFLFIFNVHRSILSYRTIESHGEQQTNRVTEKNIFIFTVPQILHVHILHCTWWKFQHNFYEPFFAAGEKILAYSITLENKVRLHFNITVLMSYLF